MEAHPNASQTISALRSRAENLRESCVTYWTLSGMMGFMAVATYELKSAIPAACALTAVGAGIAAVKDRVNATEASMRAENLELLQLREAISSEIRFETDY